MKIYVCGGSSEMDEVAADMQRLREMGHEITHDWVAVIRAAGEANPRTASHRDRVRWSGDDLDGLKNADLVWVRLPIKPSFGCAFEFGFAIGQAKCVIVSGDWRTTIFSSQAGTKFDEHEHAIKWLKDLKTLIAEES